MITKAHLYYINMDLEIYITVKEICQSLKVKKLTVYRWIKAGKLKAVKIGKGFRVRKEDFENFINKNTI